MTYLSPKLESRKSPIEGSGLFAKELIKKDETLLDFSDGERKIVTSRQADELFKSGFDHMYQIGDDSFVITVTDPAHAEWGHVNHSCDPNCGWNGLFKIVAMRDIQPGEEISLDYAMMESTDYAIECRCGSPKCRHRITGEDWMLPELQERYGPYFQAYLRARF